MASLDRRILWSALAEADLVSIWQYGADEWSPAAADDHIEEIFRTSSLIGENPQLGRARDEVIVGIRSIPVSPHVIFYMPREGTIEIVRVINQREDIEIVFKHYV